ncbi:hypothetical protein PAMA_000507 [Pampus argenteus]
MKICLKPAVCWSPPATLEQSDHSVAASRASSSPSARADNSRRFSCLHVIDDKAGPTQQQYTSLPRFRLPHLNQSPPESSSVTSPSLRRF